MSATKHQKEKSFQEKNHRSTKRVTKSDLRFLYKLRWKSQFPTDHCHLWLQWDQMLEKATVRIMMTAVIKVKAGSSPKYMSV